VCQTKESKQQNRDTRAVSCLSMAVLSLLDISTNNPARSHPSTHTHACACKKHKRKAEEGRKLSKFNVAFLTHHRCYAFHLHTEQMQSQSAIGYSIDQCAETSHDDRQTYFNNIMSSVWSSTREERGFGTALAFLLRHGTIMVIHRSSSHVKNTLHLQCLQP
jgi:hypothetical protein